MDLLEFWKVVTKANENYDQLSLGTESERKQVP